MTRRSTSPSVNSSRTGKPWRTRWSLTTNIVLGYVVLALLSMIVTIAAILGVRTGYRLQESATQRTQDLRSEALRLQLALTRQLPAAQSYILSGSPEALLLYEEEQTQFQASLDEISSLAQGDEESLRVDRVGQAGEQIQELLDQTIAARQAGSSSQALSQWEEADRICRGEMSTAIEELLAHAESHLQQWNQAVRRSSLTVLFLAIAAMVLALGGGVLVSAFLTRRMVSSLRTVVGATGAIAEGRLNVRVVPAGPPELVALGESVNEMAQALQTSRAELQGSLEQAHSRSEALEEMAGELRRSEQELQHRLKEAATLREATLAVTASLDLEEVLVRIMQAVIGVVPAEAASLMLIDRERQDLVFEMSLTGSRLEREPFRIPLGVGVAGWVAQHGEPLLVPDVQQDPRFYREIDQDTGFVTRSIICVPVVVRGQTIGVVEVINRLEGQFTAEEQELLSAFAAPVGIAVENAGLFEAEERERGRLQAILTGTADAIIATDGEGRITLSNPAAERAFGMVAEEVRGRPLSEVVRHDGLARAFDEARQRGEGGIPTELALPDGRTLFASLSPVAGPVGEKGWVAVMQDITHLKELDRMKSEFVATVSHDLKNPLTAIRGYADLIAALGQVDDQQRQFVDKIKQVSDKMAQLISDLLDIAKIEAGLELQIVPCSLQGVCRDVYEDTVFRAESRRQQLHLALPDDLPPVCADPKRLRQVLLNLVGNAIKYTPEGGQIRLAAECRGEQVVGWVQDSGIGIPPADLPYIFDKFYRVNREEESLIEGTGLGLSIVKSIVERHGGQIWVDSEIGRGSTFFFALGAAREGRCPEEEPS